MNTLRSLLAVGLCLAALACNKQEPPTVAKVGNPTPPPTAKVTPQPEVSGRAPVQHGIDQGASQINRTPVKITVEQLLAMRKKIGDGVDLSSYHDKRYAPFETSTFEVDATLKRIKHEKDGDFYCVIQGDSGAQAVVEVPDPTLCQGSPLLPDITKARQTLDERFHPTPTDQTVNEKATFVGVGYLGSRKRKGSGSFGAAARLMPGISVSFPDSAHG